MSGGECGAGAFIFESVGPETYVATESLGSTRQLFICLRVHGESCNCADGDGRGGQPWRRSRPHSSEVHKVGDIEAVTHVLWISTC